MNRYVQEKKMSARTFIKVYSLFKRKGWKTDNIPKSKFGRFCNRFAWLSSEQQTLMLNLTKRFECIESKEYYKLFIDIIDNNEEFRKSAIAASKKIHICPLIAPDDVGKIKSSTFLLYNLKSYSVHYESFFNKKSIRLHDSNNPDWVERIRGNEKIILIDDFVGTGETAIKALEAFVQQGKLKKNIAVLALVAQKTGIEAIDKFGIKVYTNKIIDRGIRDYYKNDDLIEAIEIMREIEEKLNVDERFAFGYKQSEALIAMIRPPNNTFPVFWWENKQHKIAPFPRKR